MLEVRTSKDMSGGNIHLAPFNNLFELHDRPSERLAPPDYRASCHLIDQVDHEISLLRF